MQAHYRTHTHDTIQCNTTRHKTNVSKHDTSQCVKAKTTKVKQQIKAEQSKAKQSSETKRNKQRKAK